MHTIAFLAGISIPLVLYIALATVLTDAGQHFQIPTARQVFGNIPIVSVLAGVLLLGAGLRLETSKQVTKISQDAHKETSDKLFDTKTLFWFGLIKMGTSLSSIAAILLGVSFIKSFVTRGAFQAVALVWFLAISILPFVGIAGVKRYAPSTFARLQRSSDKVASYDWLKVLRWVFLASGAYLVIFGLLNIG